MPKHPFHRDPWIKYGSPSKCFLAGTQGPCPAGMRIGLQSNNPNEGICKCNCFFPFSDRARQYYDENKGYSGSGRNWDPYLNEKQPFCYDFQEKRTFAYSKEMNGCYGLFTQVSCDFLKTTMKF
jgi:hypothetical protein